MVLKLREHLLSRTLSRWTQPKLNSTQDQRRVFTSSTTFGKILPPTLQEILRPKNDKEAPGQYITVSGWIRSVRRMKNVCFAAIADGSTATPLQAVLSPQQASGLSTGTTVQIAGDWKPSIQGGQQRMELLAKDIRILGEADPLTYPMQKKYHTAEYMRTIPHLRSRLTFNTLMLRLRSKTIGHIHAYFDENSFVQTHPPVLTSSDCEGAGEVFQLAPAEGTSPFFGKATYLSVSSQLHLEALALSVGRVWTLAPAFRAEKSDTARHLSEFYMLEAEVAFVDDLDVLMDITEAMMKAAVLGLLDSGLGQEIIQHKKDVDLSSADILQERWLGLLNHKWARMTYTEAVDCLQLAVTRKEVEFVFPIAWGSALQSEHEKHLASCCGGPVFVTDYPSSIKPFYMLQNSGTERRTAACFDLLVPNVGELVGGSLREYRLEELRNAMIDMPDESKKNLSWYLDLRVWGTAKHGGFGLGFDRFLSYLAGVENIREISTFPRWHGRCNC